MLCGTRRNLKIIDYAGDQPPTKSTPPKKTNKKVKVNPYSTVGLNKFSDLLTDLDARRARILAKARPEEASSMEVRFTYSVSHDFVPIILRQLDDYPRYKPPATAAAKRLAGDGKNELTEESAVAPNGEIQAAAAASSSPEMRKAEKKSFSWCLREVGGWSRLNSWLLVLVVILLSLLMLGRAFSICCTTIGWYSLPLMARGGNNGDEKRLKKRRQQQLRRKKRDE